MKTKFKQYKRKGLSEMVPYVDFTGDTSVVSISDADLSLPNEEFRLGYIARNPKNHSDMWYVAKEYFDDNLEPVESTNPLDAAEFLKSKGIKDTLYDIDNPGQWIKGGLSRLLDQYATQRTAEVGVSECPICEGSGSTVVGTGTKMMTEEKCYNCDGTGKVTTPLPEPPKNSEDKRGQR